MINTLEITNKVIREYIDQETSSLRYIYKLDANYTEDYRQRGGLHEYREVNSPVPKELKITSLFREKNTNTQVGFN